MIHVIIGSTMWLLMRANNASWLTFKGVLDGAGPYDSIPVTLHRAQFPVVYVCSPNYCDCHGKNMMVLWIGIFQSTCVHCCGSTDEVLSFDVDIVSRTDM